MIDATDADVRRIMAAQLTEMVDGLALADLDAIRRGETLSLKFRLADTDPGSTCPPCAAAVDVAVRAFREELEEL